MIIEDIHKEFLQDKKHLEEFKTEDLFNMYETNSRRTKQMIAFTNNNISEEELREEIRKKLSCILEGTSEEKPLHCDIILEGNPENCGLSSLEIPSVDKAFLQEGEGIIWFHIDHTPDDEWVEFDDMYTEELFDILNELS